MGRERRRIVGTGAGVIGALAGLLAPVATPMPAAAAPSPLQVNVSGTDGVGRIEAPGLSCAEDGDGAYWHYAYTSSIPANSNAGFSKLPATVRLNIDLHSDEVRFPNTNANPLPPQPNAFLLGNESTASLLNARGTLRMRLSSGGGCAGGSTMNFDGIRATTTGAGSNTWVVDSGTGAYEGTTGSGTFTLTADVAPGADNPFQLGLNGTINVPQPDIQIATVQTFWGNLGVDYLTRRVSVTYRITNVGDGIAYAASLTNTVPQTSGVAALGPVPQGLGDLDPGESATVTVRYQLNVLPPPCQLIILGCFFTSRLDVAWTDAIDVPKTYSLPLSAQAPILPPPL